MSIERNLLAVAIGCTVGNVLYQMTGDGNYATALERTVFQLAALGLVWFSDVVFGRAKQ